MMKITFGWLLEHLDHKNLDFDTILEYLTNVGLEVENVQKQHLTSLQPMVLGKILKVDPHPNADRLNLCTVNIGQPDPVVVVCGAPNVKEGLGVVYASVGTYIPGSDFTLTPKEIRGIVSEGMLCSGKELQLSSDGDGILELNTEDQSMGNFDSQIGYSLQEYFGGFDPIIDFKVTPNRGDLLGVHGIAREVAAGGFATLKSSVYPHVLDFTNQQTPSIQFELSSAPWCTGMASASVVLPSCLKTPQKIQNRLRAISIQPKYFTVDISNYIMIDQNRPSHMFDMDKIEGNSIQLKTTQTDQSFTDLMDNTYILPTGTPVMEDNLGIISIPGIIGGKRTAISENTKNILIELATFDPKIIAKTGRILGVMTDARYRFERGVDPNSLKEGLQTLCFYFSSKMEGKIFDTYNIQQENSPSVVVDFYGTDVEKLGGITVPKDKMQDILRQLGYDINPSNQDAFLWHITVPGYRSYVQDSYDIVFDILRMIGLDTISEKALPFMPTAHNQNSISQDKRYKNMYPTQDEQQLSNALASFGYNEVISWSFMNGDLLEDVSPTHQIQNPLAENLNTLRPSALYYLIDFAGQNLRAGMTGGRLFEMGQNYAQDSEELVCTALQFGNSEKFWRNNHVHDVYDIKSDLEQLLALYGLFEAGSALSFLDTKDHMTYEEFQSSLYHPSRSLQVVFRNIVIAQFGQIHPQMQKKIAPKTDDMVGFELFYERIYQFKMNNTLLSTPHKKVPSLQRHHRDVAFFIPKDIPVTDIVQIMEKPFHSSDHMQLESIKPFDIFIPKDDQTDDANVSIQSIAFRISWYPITESPNIDDINQLLNKIIYEVQSLSSDIRVRDH